MVMMLGWAANNGILSCCYGVDADNMNVKKKKTTLKLKYVSELPVEAFQKIYMFGPHISLSSLKSLFESSLGYIVRPCL
jgi:hypothetical protein